ncbi:hypothetical protein ACVQ8P_01025 [Dellaglioa sp. BT-FLS60]
MVKFSKQFKIQVIEDYLSSLVISWVQRYSSELNVLAPNKFFDAFLR